VVKVQGTSHSGRLISPASGWRERPHGDHGQASRRVGEVRRRRMYVTSNFGTLNFALCWVSLSRSKLAAPVAAWHTGTVSCSSLEPTDHLAFCVLSHSAMRWLSDHRMESVSQDLGKEQLLMPGLKSAGSPAGHFSEQSPLCDSAKRDEWAPVEIGAMHGDLVSSPCAGKRARGCDGCRWCQ
jgi:hypothetical protein